MLYLCEEVIYYHTEYYEEGEELPLGPNFQELVKLYCNE